MDCRISLYMGVGDFSMISLGSKAGSIIKFFISRIIF